MVEVKMGMAQASQNENITPSSPQKGKYRY